MVLAMGSRAKSRQSEPTDFEHNQGMTTIWLLLSPPDLEVNDTARL